MFIVIPAYNEASVVGSVVREVAGTGGTVVVVDDGSKDATAEVARGAGATVVRHAVNLGQGAALHTGMQYALDAGAELVCTFDADGQHDPATIGRMVGEMQATGADVILCSRFRDDQTRVPALKRQTLRAALAFTRLHTRLNITDTHNGLRLMNRHAALLLKPAQPGMAHASEMLGLVAKHHLRYREIPTVIRYSDYSVRKGQSIFNAITILFEMFYSRLTR
ncbi:MAG: glycosyltransferase family 2 protein [Candidatus Velthaea sp.]